jgi:hypothetical protein
MEEAMEKCLSWVVAKAEKWGTHARKLVRTWGGTKVLSPQKAHQGKEGKGRQR